MPSNAIKTQAQVKKMNRKHSSARGRGIQKEKRKSQLELVDLSKDGKRKPESVASTSGTVEVSQRVVARKEQHGSDSDISVEGAEIEQQQQCREMALGTGKNREKHEQVQPNAEVPQGRKSNYHLEKLPKSFSTGCMEEEYHALCTIKTAADRLVEKGVLSCVAERAMSWLRLSYKKIHDKDLPRQACRVEETQVLETLEAITECNTSPETKNTGTAPGTGKPSLEDLPQTRSSKRVAQPLKINQPANKKSKPEIETEHDDYDDDETLEAEASAASDISSTSEEEDEGGWKNTYKKSSQPNPKMKHLSEYFLHLQTFFGGDYTEGEALEYTRCLHKLMEDIDCTSTSIDGLFDPDKIWEWANARIETTMAGRTVQKYLLSLEKFCHFIVHERSPQLPKLRKASREMAQEVKITCPNWRRSVNKIAAERRWKKMEDDPEYMEKVCKEGARRRADAFDENILGLRNPTPIGSRPLRSKWDRKDEKLLLRFFAFKPPKDVIRGVCEEVDELQELVARKGFDRVYEKVKTMYRRTRAIIG